MGQLMKLTGIVLSSSNVDEYDKRLVILTKEKGKITAFARGARKQGSPYTAACQSFAYGVFTVFKGKNYNLNAVDIEDYFSEFRDDIHRLYRALYFCEMADYFTVEGNDELAIMQLLYVTLNALRKKVVDPELIQVIFEVKILAYFGLMMETSCCIVCGTKPEDGQQVLTHFHSDKGGVICTECAARLAGTIPMQESTLYTLQYILSQPVTKLYHFQVSDDVLYELQRISKDYLSVQVQHPFKTLEFLELLPKQS